MSREQTYLSIILKKQPLGEADELITVFSKEQGKLRVLAKSIKLAKSRLQHALQPAFLVKLSLAGAHLPKVIGAEVVESFSEIRSSLESSAAVFYALELALKFTADAQPNEALFDLLKGFLGYINSRSGKDHESILPGLVKFQIDFLQAVGFSVNCPPPEKIPSLMVFNNLHGGFISQALGTGLPVSQHTYLSFLKFRKQELTFNQVLEMPQEQAGQLQQILAQFLEYQLERRLKAQDFLTHAGVI